MQIIAFEHTPSTEFGGSERSYFDVLTGLASRGHSVVLFYATEGNLISRYESAEIRTVRAGFPYFTRPGRRFSDLSPMLGGLRQFKRFPRDSTLIYLNFAEALPFALLLKVRFGFRIVCHLRIGYFGLTRQILWAGSFADRFIVINKRFRETFESVFKRKGKVTVIYNGLTIPAKLLSPVGREANVLKILYLGRIAPEKGVIELVRAASAALHAGVRLSIQITGDFIMSHSGDYRAELGDAIEKAAMRPYITLSGAVDDPIGYMRGFNLFVMPSTWEEPFGRTVPEAILAGVPVLARKVGMMDEIMADNPHFLFNSDTELTEKIIQFAEGKLIFDFPSARNRIATEFNKERMIEQVERVLVDVSNDTTR